MVFFTYFLTEAEGKCLGRYGIFKKNKILSFAFKHFLQAHHYAFLPNPISQNKIAEEIGCGGCIAGTVLDGECWVCSEVLHYSCATWQSLGVMGQQIPNVA